MRNLKIVVLASLIFILLGPSVSKVQASEQESNKRDAAGESLWNQAGRDIVDGIAKYRLYSNASDNYEFSYNKVTDAIQAQFENLDLGSSFDKNVSIPMVTYIDLSDKGILLGGFSSAGLLYDEYLAKGGIFVKLTNVEVLTGNVEANISPYANELDSEQIVTLKRKLSGDLSVQYRLTFKVGFYVEEVHFYSPYSKSTHTPYKLFYGKPDEPNLGLTQDTLIQQLKAPDISLQMKSDPIERYIGETKESTDTAILDNISSVTVGGVSVDKSKVDISLDSGEPNYDMKGSWETKINAVWKDNISVTGQDKVTIDNKFGNT
ncbi:hypothetical protein E0T50_000443, partial [Enterococcus faecalis]|nr:hypothetical protein [Enterococcus faecalis]